MPDTEDLRLDKLASGDRPSVYAAGLVCARALRENGIVVLIPDVLGRIHLLPGEAVEVKVRPRIPEAELNKMTEEDALRVLVEQNESEEFIMAYLKRRVSAAQEEAP